MTPWFSLTSRARPALLMAALLALTAGSAASQSLTVSRGARTETVTPAQFAALPRQRVQVTQHDQSHDFEGVTLANLAATVGVDVSRPLQGRDLSAAIRITAADGYQVVLALSEIDPATRKGAVLLADRDGGKPLDAANGPYRLVVSDDLRPARSARQVLRIEVLDLATSDKKATAK
jgi:hypothetical protein